MPTYGGGRHEYGQNFLVNTKTKEHMLALVEDTVGPIVEIGPGHGSLTRSLGELERPVTAVEIHEQSVQKLRTCLTPSVEVIHTDFLTWKLPVNPYVVVGNLPFHLTTSMLRKILHDRAWTDAIVLVQWEVARRRAGVGGASMMTAQWWPWVEFSVAGRVPKTAFEPMPSVDGGILTMHRRTAPLLPASRQGKYRNFVHAVFTGRGNGIANILTKTRLGFRREQVRGQLADLGISPQALPKHLTDVQWAQLYQLVPEPARKDTNGRSSRKHNK